MSRVPGILVERNVQFLVDRRTLPEIMATYERIVIIQALQLNGFSRRETAISLGISRNHLYSRIRLLKINLNELPRYTRMRSKRVKKESS
jgi:DNA-binding NtrC family response regulator